LPGDGAGARMSLDVSEHPGHVIVAAEAGVQMAGEHVGGTRLAEGLVERLRQPEVAWVDDQAIVGRGADAGQRLRRGLGGAVAGGIVDEDRLQPVGLPRKRGMSLAYEALQEITHVAGRVVEEKGDGDARSRPAASPVLRLTARR